MTRCANTYHTERHHAEVARREREAERIERDTRESIKYNVDEVLDELLGYDYLRDVLIAVRANADDDLALGVAVRGIINKATDEAVRLIVDRELGQLGL